MLQGLKRVLKAIGHSAVTALPSVPDVVASSPSLTLALWKLGVQIGNGALAEAVKRLESSGVADPKTRKVVADNPLWSGFFTGHALAGHSWASDELRRSMEHLSDDHPGLWHGLIDALAESPLEGLTGSLARRSCAMAADSPAALEAENAYSAALDALAAASTVAQTGLDDGPKLRKTARKFAQPVAQTRSASKAVKKSAKTSAKKTSSNSKRKK